MIIGIGSDLVAVERMAQLLERRGENGARRLLMTEEFNEFIALPRSKRAAFLAKHFAAKEALGKALGCGLRPPATLGASGIVHDHAGKPYFMFNSALAAYCRSRHWQVHLSISDERQYALAFVVLEQKE